MGVQGVPVPPTFWSGGYRTPHFFGRMTEKITATFPVTVLALVGRITVQRMLAI